MSSLRRIYRAFKGWLQQKYPTVFNVLNNHKDKVKFIFSGGTAASVDLVLLFLFHGVLHIHVIVSAAMAFICAFFTSFFLQKYWTFRDERDDVMYSQMLKYLVVAIIGISFTIIGMYLLVEKMHIYYLIAQIMVMGSLAIGNFLIYKLIIFKKIKKAHVKEQENFDSERDISA